MGSSGGGGGASYVFLGGCFSITAPLAFISTMGSPVVGADFITSPGPTGLDHAPIGPCIFVIFVTRIGASM